jgi:Family of unknown function (DUF5330)
MSSTDSNRIIDSSFIDCGETPLSSLRYAARSKEEEKRRKSREASNRKGKAMLFLIRTAFWLTIIVLLLPTDEQQRSEVYGTAQAAVHDVATFCDRNPETCVRGKDAFAVLVQKAQFGARMLMDLINGKDEADGFEQPSSKMPPLFAPARFDVSGSQDTLKPEDREEAWMNPGSAGT